MKVKLFFKVLILCFSVAFLNSNAFADPVGPWIWDKNIPAKSHVGHSSLRGEWDCVDIKYSFGCLNVYLTGYGENKDPDVIIPLKEGVMTTIHELLPNWAVRMDEGKVGIYRNNTPKTQLPKTIITMGLIFDLIQEVEKGETEWGYSNVEVKNIDRVTASVNGGAPIYVPTQPEEINTMCGSEKMVVVMRLPMTPKMGVYASR